MDRMTLWDFLNFVVESIEPFVLLISDDAKNSFSVMNFTRHLQIDIARFVA